MAHESRRRWIASLCAIVLATSALAVIAVLPDGPAQAAATVPFTSKFSVNANGAMISIGNGLLTCPASSACTSAQNGAAQDNNNFTMVNLDADNVAGTVNSSSSQLALPAGASVLWAGLYWGARLDAGTNGSAGNAANIGTMSFRAPGDASYRTVTASAAARDQFGPNGSSYNAYQRFADVTSIVQSTGNGVYWGANVTAATGVDRYAGWALTVVYSAPGLPLRNLTVFDGFNVVGQGTPQSVTVSGFLAPKSGTVDAQLTMVAYEGDLSLTGDYTLLNSTQLATPLSPGSNFFNSTNDLNGTSVTTRTPAYRNMLGYDIKNLGASGAIPNSATSATFTFSSNGDVYYPGVVGLAINLYAPDFTASAKSVVDVNGNNPARPGDTLQYIVNYANTGQDAALGAVSHDTLPANTTYVPGSLALVNPVTGATTPLTDSPGDDRGELAGRTVTVRLGAGANATTGGRMACSGTGCTDDGTSRQSYTFQVTLDGAAGGTTVTNLATLDYRTETTGTAATYTSNVASIAVLQQADVGITKSLSPDPALAGSTVTATLTVRNNGPNTAAAVTVTDPIPIGWNGVTATTPQGTCTAAGGTVTCSLGNLANGAVLAITLTGTVDAASTATSLSNVASVSTTSFDPVPGNNVSGDTVSLARQADLAIAKSPSPSPAVPGTRVVWTLTVTNQGPSDAQNVTVDDVLDDPTQATITGTEGGTSCVVQPSGSARCTIPTLAAGATVTIPLDTVLATGLAQGTVVGNTATVASSTPDPVPSNNTVHATVTTSAPTADVRMTKTAPAQVDAGQTITWTLDAANWGPSDAEAVTVTDTAPAGVTLTSASTTRGTCTVTASSLSCDLGTLLSAGVAADGSLQAGAGGTITLTGTVSALATGTLANTATVTSSTPDPDMSNNSATASSTVTASYDLSVAKTANRTTLPGQAPRPVVYTITISNAGPSAATDVAVDDSLPPQLALDSITGCSATTTATGFTCVVPGPILPGGTAVITVNMTAQQVLAGGPDVVETVTISAAGDTDPGNNTASWTLSGLPFVDLSLAKSAPATVTPGAGTGVPAGAPIPPVPYTFVITNNNDPTNVAENLAAIAPVILDTLPAGATFVSASVTAGQGQGVGCTTAAQALRCQLTGAGGISPDLDAGQSVTVQVLVSLDPGIPAGSSLTNTATVQSGDPVNNPDNNPSNNTSAATSIVEPLADVAVTDFTVDPVDPAATGPGTLRHVHVVLTNNGPSTATDVTYLATRTVDAFVTNPGTQPSNCVNTGREASCTIENGAFGSSLLPGQSVTIDYDIQVSASAAPGSYPDTVQVATTTPETTLANNQLTRPIVVGPAVTALAVTKTPIGTIPNPNESPSPADPTLPHPSFVAGSTFSYQIAVSVPSTGFSDAENTFLTDVLPPGFTATTVSSTGSGLCTITPEIQIGVGVVSDVECELGTVPGWQGTTPPPAVIVTINGVLSDDAATINGGDQFAEQVPNTATATTSTPLTGGQASVSGIAHVDIVNVADLKLFKTPDSATVNAGGSIGYTLTVVNAGPSGVAHAVVTDQLPDGFTLDAAQSDCAPPLVGADFNENLAQPRLPAAANVIACRVGVVGAGQTVSIHIVTDTDPGLAAGDATNTAVVGSLANDVHLTNNTATATVAVQRLTNVAISSSVSTDTPAAGQEVTYTGYLVNNGPSTAVNVNGETTFPPGFVPVSFDVPASGCTWNQTPPADPASVPWQNFQYVLTCMVLPQFAVSPPGSSATDVVVMHIPGDTPAGAYTTTAVVRNDTPETTLADNTTSQTVLVQRVSDTSITKTLVEPNPLVAGQPATWRLTVHNAGPSIADNVVASDNVPTGMTYVSATVEGGAACPAPTTNDLRAGDTATIVQCPLGTLAVGASASVLVTFGVNPDTAGADLCNTALVGSGSLDPNVTDNQATACGSVTASVDIAVTLSPATQTTVSGGQVQLTATVRNNGPSQATGVVATLAAPPAFTGVSGVAISWPAGRPKPADGVGGLTFAVGTLAPGEQVVYQITGTATGSPGDVLPFTFSATPSEPDTVTANNTAAAQVDIVAGPPPSPAPPGSSPSAIAATGSDVLGPLVIALALSAAGLLLLGARRRRTRRADDR